MNQNENIDTLLKNVKDRYLSLPDNDDVHDSFIMHLKSLARFYNEPMDYNEDPDVAFPEEISIAYAVCHPDCGIEEFVVDGNRQECQVCGSLMFRTETKKYRRISD